MKKAKKFLIAFVVAVVYFIISLVIQCSLTIIFANQATMILLAVLSGTVGFVMSMLIIEDIQYSKGKKVDFVIYSLMLIYMSIASLLLLSTFGSEISMILFMIGIPLAGICLLYLAIKELIIAYKKYKENK